MGGRAYPVRHYPIAVTAAYPRFNTPPIHEIGRGPRRLRHSMFALSPQCGDTSLCLGRLGLPDRLPFSKPKVNWLLHARSAFRRTPSLNKTHFWVMGS